MESLLPSHEKVKIALISPYEDMAEIFARQAAAEGLLPYIASATLEKAAELARQIARDTEVIISRGGTAEYIREVVDIPVVSVPITSFDAIRAIYEAKSDGTDIAFFNFSKKMYGMRDIEKMLGVTIYEYTFESEQDIENGLKDAQRKGVKVAIGGILVKSLAGRYGVVGRLIECGEEAMHISIQEAVNLAQLRRTERNRAARIQSVLDSITEGIIVTDEENRVVMYNPAAEKIFKIAESQVLGKLVQDVIPNTRMHKVFASGEAEMAVLQQIHEGTIATNRIPIFLDGQRIGVASTFENVTKIQQLEQQIRKQMHNKGFIAKNRFSDILTVSPALEETKELAALYATTDAAVLIQGESGTGKELFAQSIHNASRRATGPFVAINCAAIPEQLLESELFGYEGGAFTGARKEGKAGLFELAHKGTIFLDEIGEIPKSLQARLLRVLQEKEIMRVGGDRIIPVDIRIISATNKDLAEKAAAGEFRDDLYYRLNVFSFVILPLRERKADIELLAQPVLAKMEGCRRWGAGAQQVKNLLLTYDWPGNVRELQNIMERLTLIFSDAAAKLSWQDMLHKVMFTAPVKDTSLMIRVEVEHGLKAAIDQVEKKIIDAMLLRYGQNHEVVAQKLGIGRTTLWRKGKGE